MVIENLLPGASIYLDLARFLIVFGAGAVATRILLMPAVFYILKRRNPDRRSIQSVEKIAALAGLFLSFIFGLQAAGFGNLVTVLGTLAAALTVAIGFGIRDQVSNFLGGLIILTDNPFIRGDYIKTEEFEGVVVEIRLRHTVLNGANDEKLIVPNSALTLNPVRNLSRKNKTRTKLELEANPGKAGKMEDAVIEVIKNTEEVLESPGPETRITEVKDKAKIEAFYWVKDARDVKEVKSKVLRRIIKTGEKRNMFESGNKDQ